MVLFYVLVLTDGFGHPQTETVVEPGKNIKTIGVNIKTRTAGIFLYFRGAFGVNLPDPAPNFVLDKRGEGTVDPTFFLNQKINFVGRVVPGAVDPPIVGTSVPIIIQDSPKKQGTYLKIIKPNPVKAKINKVISLLATVSEVSNRTF